MADSPWPWAGQTRHRPTPTMERPLSGEAVRLAVQAPTGSACGMSGCPDKRDPKCGRRPGLPVVHGFAGPAGTRDAEAHLLEHVVTSRTGALLEEMTSSHSRNRTTPDRFASDHRAPTRTRP